MNANNLANKRDSAEAAGFTAHDDLDNVSPGAEFHATWSFKNDGTTTWDGRYKIVYTLAAHSETAAFDRSPLGAKTAWAIGDVGAPAKVPPGATVQLTLPFTAPGTAGTHATNWQLQNPAGKRFGPVRWMRAVVSGSQPADDKPALSYQSIDFQNSVANYENMPPGRQFSGKWTFRNTGTATWSGDFQIVYQDASTPETANSSRSRMGSPIMAKLRAVSNRESVLPGETVVLTLDLVAPASPGSYVYHWQLRDQNGNPFGGTRWLKIGVKGAADGPSPTPTTGGQFGMNVNIQPGGHPLDADRMAGLGWVRWVFWASRENKTPEQAYQERYRAIIQSYADKGIRSLIILHQDTYWGNAPWDNGGWNAYAQNFGKQCGRVAAACSEFGDMVAYQIYNEQDSGYGNDAGHPNPSAIGIEPRDYAPVLESASKAIRAAHPGAKVIFGGLKTGPNNGVNYIREVQQHLPGGNIPVDALAYHPYGRYVKTPFFNFGGIGKLGDAFNIFRQAFPQMPLWITEVGVAADSHIGSEHYADIAAYIREVVEEVANNYADLVPVFIWFGWTDLMRNAGVNTIDNKPKQHVYDAFLTMKNRSVSVAEPAVTIPTAAAGVDKAAYRSYTSTLTNLNAVPAGTKFTSRWIYENSGTSTWGPGYKLVYETKGDNPAPMMPAKSFELSAVTGKAQIEPGQKVTISLAMTAPKMAGRTYHSQWHLRNPQGESLGFIYEELTVVPAPTAGTGARAAGMKHIDDKTIPDNTRLVAGTDFDKQWFVQNNGGRHWGPGFRLVFIEGDLNMARGVAGHMVPKAKPGDKVTLTIPMTAPPALNGQATVYSSLWRMEDDHGNKFGDPIWVKIVSTSGVSDTPGDNTPLARLLNDPSMWYSQLNPAWQGQKLGNGQATIGSWGCLMTCMAMALTAHGTPVTPQQLNEKAKAAGAFGGSAIQFYAPASIGNLKYKMNVASWPDSGVDHAVWTGEDPIQRIDNALADGHIVIAQVDTKPNNGFYNSSNEQHWVVIVKRTPDGSDYLMIDPLTLPQHANTQPRSLMSKYGSPAPSASNETNLRNAIKSTLVYHKPGSGGN
jgi:hypothetical protein